MARLAAESAEVLRYLERRMKGLRVTFVFGWAGSGGSEGAGEGREEGGCGGRLCILSVLE